MSGLRICRRASGMLGSPSRLLLQLALLAITLSKKRKPFGDEELDSTSPTLGLAPAFSSDSETDGLVLISSASSEDMSPEDKLIMMSQQWEEVVNGLNRVTGAVKRFKTAVMEELESAD
jgi:hypothetical protein